MKLKKFTIVLIALTLIAVLPITTLAENYDLSNGSIEITADDTGQYVSQPDNGITDFRQTSATVIEQTGNDSPTENTITVTTTGDNVAQFTVKGINIESESDAIDVGDSNAEITLEEENIIYSESGSAIHVSEGDVTITGSGSLEAEIGYSENAKIGSHEQEEMSGNIHITGNATITMEDDGEDNLSGDGAGIGSGYQGEMSGDILIDGNANVTAFSQESGAGIGSGKDGNMSGDITITENAQVVAASGWAGAGIGSGYEYEDDYNADMSGNITIDGNANVTAWSQDEGSGIGSGEKGEVSGSIIIGGHAQVTAGSDEDSAGIGSGTKGTVLSTGRIIIKDNAKVTAIGQDEGCGIGTGENRNMEGMIIIRDGAQVTAIAGYSAAAIGTDDDGDMRGHIVIIGNASIITGETKEGQYVPCDEACLDPNSNVYEDHLNGDHQDDEYYRDDVWFDYKTQKINYTLNPDAIGYIGDGQDSHDSNYGHYIFGPNVSINGIKGNDVEKLKDIVNMRLSGEEHDGEPENLTILDIKDQNGTIVAEATGEGKILALLYDGDENPPTKPGTYFVSVVMGFEKDGELIDIAEFDYGNVVLSEPITRSTYSNNPKTGDDISMLIALISVAALSATVGLLVFNNKRKYSK